jgi:4-hydroxybenzoate polyprenyltransferase
MSSSTTVFLVEIRHYLAVALGLIAVYAGAAAGGGLLAIVGLLGLAALLWGISRSA